MHKIQMALKYEVEHPDCVPIKRRIETKFTKGKPDECWLWIGAKTMKGYGYIMLEKTCILAHRLNWYFNRGDIPKNLCVCHHCDTPLCVNPNHLFLGTKKDNTQDAEKKGRLHRFRGRFHPNSKITESDVVEMRKLIAAGATGSSMAKRFKLTRSTICSIRLRHTWQHVA